MINGRVRTALEMTGAACTLELDAGVSFGLIVTELVINLLEHGSADVRRGGIAVDYRRDVARPTPLAPEGGIELSDNHPGATIRIVHHKEASTIVG